MSPTTVASALAGLRTRGVVVTRTRSRSYVSWRPPIGGTWHDSEIPQGVRDLASGNPDPSLLPDVTPFLRRLEPPGQLYGGEPVLRELSDLATADLAASKITSEQGIAVVSGALEGMERALQAQLHPGDIVAVEDPGFAGLFDLLRALGLALRPVPIDARGMRAAALSGALDEGAQAVVFNPRGQNPTGASLDATRAAELRQVLDQCPDAMVIEDDHLGPIAGAPFLTLTNDRRRWAVVRSIAKSLGPDLRLAILAGDARTMSRVRGRQALGPHWVSHLLQRLVAMLLSDRTVDTGLARAARTYSRRRERLVAALRERGIEVHAQAGITVWIPVPDEAHVVQALLQRGWAVSPGAPYRLQSERAVRVTISALQEDEADDLASAIANSLRPSLRTRTS